ALVRQATAGPRNDPEAARERTLAYSRRQHRACARNDRARPAGGQGRLEYRAEAGAMIVSGPISNVRPKPDQVLVDIADYVVEYTIASKEAYETARHCLIDTLGCGLEALSYPACTKLLGPIVPGTVVPNGAKV